MLSCNREYHGKLHVGYEEQSEGMCLTKLTNLFYGLQSWERTTSKCFIQNLEKEGFHPNLGLPPQESWLVL